MPHVTPLLLQLREGVLSDGIRINFAILQVHVFKQTFFLFMEFVLLTFFYREWKQNHGKPRQRAIMYVKIYRMCNSINCARLAMMFRFRTN